MPAKKVNNEEASDETRVKLRNAVNKRNKNVIRKQKQQEYEDEQSDDSAIYMSDDEDKSSEEEQVPVRRKNKKCPVRKQVEEDASNENDDNDGSDSNQHTDKQENGSIQAFQNELVEQLKLMGQKINEFENDREEKKKRKPEKEKIKQEQRAILEELLQDFEKRRSKTKVIDSVISKKREGIVNGCKF